MQGKTRLLVPLPSFLDPEPKLLLELRTKYLDCLKYFYRMNDINDNNADNDSNNPRY